MTQLNKGTNKRKKKKNNDQNEQRAQDNQIKQKVPK